MFEDMLHMYVMDKPTKWKDYLHLLEFAYNNGQQASLGMIHAHKNRMNIKFIIRDHVYLRVRENKSSLKLGSCAKRSPR